VLGRPTDITAWKVFLNDGLPLILIFFINRELYFQIPSNGYTHPPLAGTKPSNAHAVTVVGYDDLEARFIIQDCRGEGFGDSGKWYLPYVIAQSPSFTNSLAVIKKIGKGGYS